MAIIVAWGLLLAWIRSQGSTGYGLIVAADSYVAWGLSFLIAFACARRFGPILRESRAQATVSAIVALVAAAGLYLAWGHRRAFYIFNPLQKGFPYPDPALNALDLWFEARHPLPRGTGSMKLHGEWNRVTVVVGTAVLVTVGVCGLLVGVPSNRPKEEKMPMPRLVGVIVALTGLTLLTPLIVAIAIAVRIRSPGPVLIREPRRRDDGTSFSIDRFRTNDPHSDQPTRIGRFLQMHSLDQLPALITLLRGGMTLSDYWDLIRETAV